MSNVPDASQSPACQAVRARLDDHLSGELPEEASREMREHLATCPQCAAELAASASLRAQVRAAVRAMQAPAGFEARIRRALRAAEGGSGARRRTGLWAVAAAAAVILCAALLNVLRVQSNPEKAILRKAAGPMAAVLRVGLRDHLECAVFREYSKEPLPAAEMAAELGPGFADLTPLLQSKVGDFRVIQAHHCEAGGRQFTHFILFGNGKVVSVLLTRQRPGEWLSAGIHQSGVDRFQVVVFESGNELAYVISDLDVQRNLQLAASVAPTIREFLTEHTTLGQAHRALFSSDISWIPTRAVFTGAADSIAIDSP